MASSSPPTALEVATGRSHCRMKPLEMLGARTQEREQVMLAFALNRPRILKAIAAKALACDGERIVLEPRDFD